MSMGLGNFRYLVLSVEGGGAMVVGWDNWGSFFPCEWIMESCVSFLNRAASI